MNAIDRARDDLANDRAWKAHERLQGLIGQRYDHEIVSLLAETHHAMRNYPAAGALWFILGRDDESAQRAIAAWHEKCPTDDARLNSLPKRIRLDAEGENIQALRDGAARWQSERSVRDQAQNSGGGSRALDWGCGLLALMLVAYTIIGFVTILHWIWGFPI